jgi:hypothetical protein
VLWDYFFNDALPHSEHQARARVRASLQLSQESADFEEEDGDADDDIEYKSMEGAPTGSQPKPSLATQSSRRPALDAGLGFLSEVAIKSLTPHQVRGDVWGIGSVAPALGDFVPSCKPKNPKVDAASQAAYLLFQARPGREAPIHNNAPSTFPFLAGSF